MSGENHTLTFFYSEITVYNSDLIKSKLPITRDKKVQFQTYLLLGKNSRSANGIILFTRFKVIISSI